jgi:hypothetical protein
MAPAFARERAATEPHARGIDVRGSRTQDRSDPAKKEKGMRRLILAVVVAMIALVVASPAYAWWGWTTQAANQRLKREGLKWNTGHEQVYFADCKGAPPSYREGGRVFWRNFNCYVETDAPPSESHYFIRLAVKGEHKWRHSFVEYAS